MKRFQTYSSGLLALLLAAAPATAQGLLTDIFRNSGRPAPAALPALPAMPAMPEDAAPGFGGLTGGTGFVQVNSASHQILLQRLRIELQAAQQEYIRAIQAGDATKVQAAFRKLQAAQYRYDTARANPGARFFPAFTENDMTTPGQPDPGQGEAGGGGGDQSVLPGELRNISFHRVYARWPGGRINTFVPGHVGIVISQDNGGSDPKGVIIANALGPAWYNIREENDAEGDNTAEFHPGQKPDTVDPRRMVDAWIFDKVRGSGKNKTRQMVVDVRKLPNNWEGAYDPSGIRFARIRHEEYTQGTGDAAKKVVQRVYYKEGGTTAIASIIDGTFQGNPALILRMGTGPEAQPIFRFAFPGWIKDNPPGVDARLKDSVGRFLDAWITSEPWRSTVGISHNFVVDDDD